MGNIPHSDDEQQYIHMDIIRNGIGLIWISRIDRMHKCLLNTSSGNCIGGILSLESILIAQSTSRLNRICIIIILIVNSRQYQHWGWSFIFVLVQEL